MKSLILNLMRILKLTFILFMLLFGSSSAEAFDRLTCQPYLESWVIKYNGHTEELRSRLNDSAKQQVTKIKYSEEQSQEINIYNEKNQLVATVFPWNSVHVRMDNQFKNIMQFKLSEQSNSFEIEFIQKLKKNEILKKTKKTNLKRSLKCQFTF